LFSTGVPAIPLIFLLAIRPVSFGFVWFYRVIVCGRPGAVFQSLHPIPLIWRNSSSADFFLITFVLLLFVLFVFFFKEETCGAKKQQPA